MQVTPLTLSRLKACHSCQPTFSPRRDGRTLVLPADVRTTITGMTFTLKATAKEETRLGPARTAKGCGRVGFHTIHAPLPRIRIAHDHRQLHHAPTDAVAALARTRISPAVFSSLRARHSPCG
eukprot:351311-Chlamydomonas_euryale.AAC.8